MAQPSGYYRPLLLVSLMFDRLVFGTGPAGHHLHSVAWHVAASGSLLLLLRRLTNPVAALCGAALFALHPVQSEVVAWIAARNDAMAATFAFLGVLVLLDEQVGWRRAAAGGALVLLAMLSKESALLAPGLLLLVDLARRGRPVGPRRYLAAAAAVGVWFSLRTVAGVGSTALPDPARLEFLLSRSHHVIAFYGLRIVAPWPLSIGPTLEYLELAPAALGAGLAVALLVPVVLVWRGGRLAAVGVVLAVIALAPAVLAIGLRGQLGERYLYLPLAGLALAVAATIPNDRRALVPLLPLGLLSMLALHHRIPEWVSDVSLWGAAVEDHPQPNTWTGLGFALVDADRAEEAAPLFLAAIDHDKPDPHACIPAMRSALRTGDFEGAERAARVSGERCARSAKLDSLRGIVFAQVGAFGDASGAVENLELTDDQWVPLVRAVVLLDSGGNPSAIAALEEDPEAFLTDAREVVEHGRSYRDRVGP